MSEQHLREMIATASAWAEERIGERGAVSPMWHLVDQDGRDLVIMPPRCDKDTSAAMMREVCKRIGAVRCLFIDEAWTAEASGRKQMAQLQAWLDAHGGSLSEYPHRIEVVIFHAEDADGWTLTGARKIIRAGGKVSLGPIEIERPPMSEGRFIGMLPAEPKRKH